MPAETRHSPRPPVPVRGLHHFAWRCRDSEETRRFYEDLLGLPLVHVIKSDHVPSTGEYCPYVHIFFQMRDGSYIAFFDLGDDIAALPSPNTPAWVNHIALRVDSVADLLAAKARLEAAGVEVLGVDRPPHHRVDLLLRPERHPPRTDHADGAAGGDGRARAARPRRTRRMDACARPGCEAERRGAWLSCNSPSSTSSPAPRWKASRACRCCARASTAPTARRPGRRRSRPS